LEFKALDVAPGQPTPFYVHPHAHEAVVAAEAGALGGDDGVHPLMASGTFSVKPNTSHAIESHGTEALRILCMDCLSTQGDWTNRR
jgi:hypothetical protein